MQPPRTQQLLRLSDTFASCTQYTYTMHPNQIAYNGWASQYDTNDNRTRDREAIALRETLRSQSFGTVLEIGCGTGKNSVWLADQATALTAVDFSEAMLARAREKVQAPNVRFVQADITQPWNFTADRFNLITFSLVLEHIEDLDAVFRECSGKLTDGGLVYVGELHPFKQYTGSAAHFEGPEGRVDAQCFRHHLSDFVRAARVYGLHLHDADEWFDEDGDGTLPRILTLLFQKKP